MTTRNQLTVDDFWTAHGVRPVLRRYDRWLVGPFHVAAESTAASNQDIDLRSLAALAADPQIVAAYGASELPEAILHVDALQIVFFGDAFRVLDPALKSALYKEAKVVVQHGESVRALAAGPHIAEPWQAGQVEADTTADTAVSVASLAGPPMELAEPFELSLRNHGLRLQWATNIGAHPFLVRLWGGMAPISAPRSEQMQIASGVCGAGDGAPVSTALTAAQLPRVNAPRRR